MTKKTMLLAVSAAALGLVVARSLMALSGAPLRTVSKVDLNRYVGTWYEIARYPNRFQRKCVGDTSATYTLRPDRKLRVVNSCRERDGEINTAKGTARVVDKATNAKLKVTFFWPFSGDYWIVGLGSDYEYAIVGEPKRKYLWILSRSPNMDPALYTRAIAQIEAAGYDPSKLMRTQQSGALDRSTGE
jgi:apolipoprotein D and lipocalin family protein